MRVGHNPARFVETVAQPAEITVALVNCIPFLSGYYQHGLEVLKTVIESLQSTRVAAYPYDVMVFDNHSCSEVRAYLNEAYGDGKIQYLVLSETNIGKIGAWNFMFGAAQGKYVVFADGDVGFRPGWLEASLALFDAYPNVGMVTARPLRTPMEYSSATLDWARQQENVYSQGQFLDWECYWEHARSTGYSEEKARSEFPAGSDHRLQYSGQTAYIGATHFQFMARADVLRQIIPLASEQPMRGERALDIAINSLGYLRLLTEKAYVWHIGNMLIDPLQNPHPVAKRKSLWRWFLGLGIIRRPLLWLNNRIFRLYFYNVD